MSTRKRFFSLALILGLGFSSLASAEPPYRRGSWRGGGDASWDPRWDWRGIPSYPPRRGTWRGGGDASWDSRWDWNPGTAFPIPPRSVPDSRFERSWEERLGDLKK